MNEKIIFIPWKPRCQASRVNISVQILAKLRQEFNGFTVLVHHFSELFILSYLIIFLALIRIMRVSLEYSVRDWKKSGCWEKTRCLRPLQNWAWGPFDDLHRNFPLHYQVSSAQFYRIRPPPSPCQRVTATYCPCRWINRRVVFIHSVRNRLDETMRM